MNETRSLYAGIPAHLAEELCETLAAADGVRIERIVTPPVHGGRPSGPPAAGAILPSCGIESQGHTSPEGFWYDQPQDEFVLLVKGRAGVRFEGDAEPVVLEAGEYLHIPGRVRHRVEWTDPDGDTVWLAVHYGEPAETERR
ncbi:MAG: cupin domain-containing protein [Deferrisomatales bacterium]|nr:cupin domain-containing protein [Deferrisomatales bacterium]